LVHDAHGRTVTDGVPAGLGFRTTADEWDRVFAINVRPHFLTCQRTLRALPSGGSIVVVSSIAA
jgi:NAD(P)-dependent dehydrogenase (short-subunit alcohol dehydrogenase family)